jgi:hypothetical protein
MSFYKFSPSKCECISFKALVIKLFRYGLVYHVLPIYGTDMGTSSIGIRHLPPGV